MVSLRLIRRAAWTWQAIAIYLLAEFAIFTIASKIMFYLTGRKDQNWWMDVVFFFLPLTFSAWWVLGVLFRPRLPHVTED